MRRWLLILLAMGWLVAAWSDIPLVAKANKPIVRAVLFWSETCPHCHHVLNETLPPLQEQYGDRLEVLTIEISDLVNYPVWASGRSLSSRAW